MSLVPGEQLRDIVAAESERALRPLLVPLPLTDLTGELGDWAAMAVDEAIQVGLVPDGEKPRALLGDLLRRLAASPFDEAFSLRFAFIDEGGIVVVEVAFLAPWATPEADLLRLVVGDRDLLDARVGDGEESAAGVWFVRNGVRGLQLLSLDRLDSSGASAEAGTLWAALHVAARREGPEPLNILARAWSPLIGTVVAAQTTLQELVTGAFIAELLPSPQ